MGLLRRRVTDDFEVLLGCLLKAPVLQNDGPQEPQRGGKKEEKGSGSKWRREKKGEKKPEASREKMRGESNISFTQKALEVQNSEHTYMPVFGHSYSISHS